MEAQHASIDALGVAWRLGATIFFVLLNGFFVAAEFSLVKVRASRIEAMATGGERGARNVQHVLEHLDRYLLACQLGVTLASLALGALCEPAVSVLILAAAEGAGLAVNPDNPWLSPASIALAFAVITTLHMTLGEQAPKMWAIQRAESTSLWASFVLRPFAFVFSPFIAALNGMSNLMLRAVGLSPGNHREVHSSQEIRGILSLAARSGRISEREYEITENTFRMISMEVRHLVVPRVDVEHLSLEKSPEENLQQIRHTKHSRLPLCEVGLDTVVGIVHARDALELALEGGAGNLRAVIREPIFVTDTMSVSDFLLDLQERRRHCAIVLDERGTAIGMAFREDALEEIVGPLGDEFDELDHIFRELGPDAFEVSGRVSLPELCSRLEIEIEEDEDEDTIGGYITARLGRLPQKGDITDVGPYEATVLDASQRRVRRLGLLRKDGIVESDDDEEEVT